jgi:HD-GYP domain-containing protein (c-di-GMP phosphodiesterase class II)
MAIAYYQILFCISFLLSGIYVLIWRKHYDINITAIFILIPIANLGYVFLAKSVDAYDASIAIKIIYLSGCFLSFFITMCVLNLCEIESSTWFRFIGFLISSVLYAFVLTIGYKPYFYKKLRVIYDSKNGYQLIKLYGPVHTLFYVVVVSYFVLSVIAIFYSLSHKRQVSNRIIKLLFFPEILAVVGYLSNPFIKINIDIMPITYIFAQIIYIFIVKRMSFYKISDMAVDSMIKTGETAFISLDLKYNYLGSNETAKKILPELKELSVDQPINDNQELKKNVLHWIKHFEDNSKNSKNLFAYRDSDNEENNRFYQVNTHYLYDGGKRCGYQIYLTDDTKNQKYISLIDKYNDELQEEVEKKTQHIVEMHNNLILSMATMVESRDNSTGGHIRRTSVDVRILIDEIKKDKSFELADELTDEFCKSLIKAAPMHDLGKVAVDDAILRKPGRFTPEEFEVMKTHAAEGARIVHEILKDTDDEIFKVIAENVAHFHHERMDGSGYPQGLVGDDIPLEARIMAIADVYDALVSKRVYKESMSFEKADEIMMDSFGKHFDKRLEPYYVKARPKLEEYYNSLEG